MNLSRTTSIDALGASRVSLFLMSDFQMDRRRVIFNAFCYRAEITSYLHTYLSYLSIIQYTYQIIDRLLNPETFSYPL